MALHSSPLAKKPEQPSPMLAIRLPKRVMDALRIAAATRRTQEKPPYTQTDIVTEALEAWLRSEGHLK
jgi:hypothetical protein